MISARLLWNPSPNRIHSSRPKLGRSPLDLQLWSRLLWNSSAYQDFQLSAQGRRMTSFGARTLSRLGCFGILRHMRIPSSCLKVGGRPPLDLQLWSWLGCFGILWYIRIHSSQLKVGGRPPLDLQLWSWLLWNPLVYQDSQLLAQGGRTTSFGYTTLVSARLLWPFALEFEASWTSRLNGMSCNGNSTISWISNSFYSRTLKQPLFF